MKASLVVKKPKLKTYYISPYKLNWLSDEKPIRTYNIIDYLISLETRDDFKAELSEEKPYSFNIFGIIVTVYKIRSSRDGNKFISSTTYYVHEKDSKILDKIAEKYFNNET